jgi:hypothetical protein
LAVILGIAASGGQGWSAWAEEPKTVQPQTENKAAKKHRVVKAPSACVGLDQSACGGKAECFWRKASTTKSGKTRKAHCRKKPQRTAKQATPA